jgi:hypothetical protein
MKHKKLSLNELKITSFITESSDLSGQKGGATNCCPSVNQCPTLPANDCEIASYNRCRTIPVEYCAFYEPHNTAVNNPVWEIVRYTA